MPKIDRNGRVSYETDVKPASGDLEERIEETRAELGELEAEEAREHPGTGVPAEGIEHPADGTMSPPVGNDEGGSVQAAVTVEPPAPPPAPPRVPPRRAVPPGAAGA
jgi:hypothetical protein